MSRISVLLLLLVASPAAALVARPMTARAPAPALRLKGGLGGVDAQLAAQLANGLFSMNGAFAALAPEQAAEVPPPPPSL